MNITSARSFFEEVGRRGFDWRLRKAHGAWQFDLEGEGSWRIDVDAGRLSVTEGKGEAPAQATMRTTQANFLRVARGEENENLVTAFLRGAFEFEGDPSFAQKLQSILPLPEAPRAANEDPRQS